MLSKRNSLKIKIKYLCFDKDLFCYKIKVDIKINL